MAAMLAISFGTAVVGWLLSLGWYRTTQSDEMDWDTAFFFGKLWLGVAVFGVIMFLIFKHS